MKLALLLTTGVESENVRTVRKLAQAALGQGHEVAIFLMDDGVYNALSLADLAAEGAQVCLCAHNAQERRLAGVDSVTSGSQYDWAHMVADADRVVSFG